MNKKEEQDAYAQEVKGRTSCQDCLKLIDILEERTVWLNSQQKMNEVHKQKIKILNAEILEMEYQKSKGGIQ
jgi:hypothetical protein